MSERIEECGKEKKSIINHIQNLSQNKWTNKLTKNPQVSFEYELKQEPVW